MSNPASSDGSGVVLDFALYAARKKGLPIPQGEVELSDGFLTALAAVCPAMAALPDDHPSSAKSIMERVHLAMDYVAQKKAAHEGESEGLGDASAAQFNEGGGLLKSPSERTLERLEALLMRGDDQRASLQEAERAHSGPAMVNNMHGPINVYLTINLGQAQS